MKANSDKGRKMPVGLAVGSEAAETGGLAEVAPRGAESDQVSITADWQRRVLGRSLRSATQKSIDRGASLILTAAHLLEKSNGDGFTVQDVADEAGQSLRTLYQYFESKDDLLLAVFEEAMRTYARLILEAVAGLSDELERLAGAILAAALMPSYTSSGLDVGLARLRLRLGASTPELIARSQQPIANLLVKVTREAARVGAIRGIGNEGAAYLIAVINAGYVSGGTLGNEYGLQPPDPLNLTAFCLRGLGAAVELPWLEAVQERLRFPSATVTFEGRGA